jgi:hypothetical protein
MQKYLLHVFLALFVFVAITGIVDSTPTTAAPLFDFNEECNQEGCDNEEIEELYDSFASECIDEGCNREEVLELAGPSSSIDPMYLAFCRLGHNFTWRFSPSGTTNCAGPVMRRLGIRRFTTSALTNAQADTILQNASNILQTSNGAGDVACNVTLTRGGNVTAFATGDGSIDSQTEFNAVIGLPGYVKVVNQINWCSGLIPNIIGCSPTPGTSLAVVRFNPTAVQEGILWAHEYGHTKGLPDLATPLRIMNGVNGAANTRVIADECTAFRN